MGVKTLKNKRVKLFISSVLLSVSLVCNAFVSYAEPTESNKDNTKTEYTQKGDNEDGSHKYEVANKEELQKKFDDIVHMIPEKKGTQIPLDNVLTVYMVMKEGGLNDYQAVGLICNFIRETSLIAGVESPYNACGIAGWLPPRTDNLVKFSKAVNDQRYTVKGYKIGGLATQAAFATAEAYTGEKTGAAKDVEWIMYLGKNVFGKWLTNLDQNKVKEMTVDKSVDFTKGLTKEMWNNMKCPLACYLYAYTNFEMGEQGLDVMARGGNCTLPLYELLTGIDAKQMGGMISEGNANDMATTMVALGLWDETQFVSWKEASNCTITFNDIMSLQPDEQHTLVTWKDDAHLEKSESILVKGARWLVLLLGILFEVWMLLIYLSYWFDRLNTFIEIDLLRLVTFGRLTVSADEDSCTFNVKGENSSEERTVNHKTVLTICVIGLFVGTFVVSGGLFKVVQGFVEFVQTRLLG